MNAAGHITSRMEIIRNGFQHGKAAASETKDPDQLMKILAEDHSEFRSVVYEGASMELALQGFADGSMQRWKLFLENTKEHSAQIFIGLGWAIAQEKITELSFTNDLDQNMMFRSWDGSGYFDAVFRQRQTIKNQNRLEYIPEKNYHEYDQGMGRSLWYIVKGEALKLPEMIALFDESRHPDLWRGIGIACSYVGGFDETILKSLSSLAGKHHKQLGVGAAMVAKSRILANCFTDDIETACNYWCGKKAIEAMNVLVKVENENGNSFEKLLDFVLEAFTEW
jgi:hypothetical protein